MGFFDGLKNMFKGKKEIVLSEDQRAVMEQSILEKNKGILELNEFQERVKSARGGINQRDYYANLAYTSIYATVSQRRHHLFREIQRIRGNWLIETVIDQITEDALSPDVTTGNILDVTSKKPKIKKAIKDLDEKFGFDTIARTLTPDMLLYGDYLLSTEIGVSPDKKKNEDSINEAEKKEKEYGLIGLKDNVIQHMVIPLSNFSEVEKYLCIDDKGVVIEKEESDFVRFSLDSRKIRIDLHEELFGSEGHNKAIYTGNDAIRKVLDSLPRFVRIGKSLIYPVLGKVKELELIEQLVPATKIAKLSNGTIFGMQVPPNYDVKKGLAAARIVEDTLNKKIGLDKSKKELTVENVMTSAGKIKVVPIFGDKGQISAVEHRSEEPDDLLSSIEDIRRTITTSVGIPFEVLFSADDESKGNMLRRYARYLRLLKNIQRSLSNGITDMIMIDLANKGIEFKKSDIEVNFVHKLVEIDNLDALEYLDTSIGMISSAKDFVYDLGEEGSPLENSIDYDKFRDFLGEQFRLVGLTDVVTKQKEKKLDDVEPPLNPDLPPPQEGEPDEQ